MTNALFLDIETVREVEHFSQLSEGKQDLFRKKLKADIDAGIPVEQLWVDKAALFAEFSKIICISIGKIDGDNLKVRSFCSRFEKQLLTDFVGIANSYPAIVGHNSNEFDIPFIRKRLMIHGIQLPPVMNTHGKKPWELQLHDTMDMWGSPAWKSRCSLALIAECFGLPNPKDEMEGSQVGELYYSMFEGVSETDLPFDKEEEVLGKISKYCQKDVITTVNVYRRMRYEPIFEEEQIIYS